MPCVAEKNAVKSLETQIRALQWELTHGHDPNKPALVAEIKQLQRELAAAKHALAVCQMGDPDPSPLDAKFSGVATLTTDWPKAPGTYQSTFEMILWFGGTREFFTVRSMNVPPFKYEALGFSIETTVILQAEFNGRLNTANGSMLTAKGSFKIDHNNVFLEDSTADMAFATGSMGPLTGNPLDGSGAATWVGSDTLVGGLPSGSRVNLSLAGTFAPNPLTP
jgi:hypothetical protein